VGIFPEGEDSRVDHGLGRLVEFRFKGPPGTPSYYITTHINCNCASWASQPQKSVTLLPWPGGRTTKATKTCGGIGGRKQTNGSFHTNPYCWTRVVPCRKTDGRRDMTEIMAGLSNSFAKASKTAKDKKEDTSIATTATSDSTCYIQGVLRVKVTTSGECSSC